MNLSLVVITRNEEDEIGRCLDSVPFAQEKIVVDSGSTDATAFIARNHGASVTFHEFVSYSMQKQWALQQASGDWVLSLDADESLSMELAEEIETVLTLDKVHSGYLLPFRVLYMGRLMRFGPWSGERHLRLFRRDSWNLTAGGVHEGIEVEGGSVGSLSKGHVVHRSYGSIDKQVGKMLEYSRLWTVDGRGAGKGSGIQHILLRPAWRFFSAYVLRGGFLEGMPGLISSTVAAFYVFLKWSELYEMELRDR